MTPAEFQHIREAKGLSRTEAARLLNVYNRATVHKWETGKRAIPGPATVVWGLLRANHIGLDEIYDVID